MKKIFIITLLSLAFIGCGDSDTDDTPINDTPLTNHVPSANAGNDKIVEINSLVTLNGLGSDSDSDTLTFLWTLITQPDSSNIELATNGNIVEFTPSIAGVYKLNLMVNDGTVDSPIDTIIVTVTDNSIPIDITNCTEVAFSIDEDTRWNDHCYKVVSSIDIDNGALLTIDEGTTIFFENGNLLSVDNGALKAIGTKTKPIIFTSEQKTSGYWYGLNIRGDDTRNVLENVIIEYAGGGHYSGALRADGRLKIRDSIIRNSGSDGFNFDSSAIVDEFKNVTSTKNTLSAGIVYSNILDAFDNTSDFTGNIGNDYLTVKGADIVTNKTWNPLTVPAFLESNFEVTDKALLTIEAGASFICNSGFRLSVSDGALKAIGTPEVVEKDGTRISAKLISFTGLQKTAGYWYGITFHYTNDTRNELAYLDVQYAGGGHYAGAISSSNGSGAVRLKMRNITIKHSGTDGFNFGSDVILDEFRHITSTQNTLTAGTIYSNLLKYIDGSSDFTGNLGGDYLSVEGYDIDSDATWKMLSVPVLIKSHFTIENGALVTIEAGASFVFESNTYFNTTSNSSDFAGIKAIGTAELPIIFTGLQHTAGFWSGMRIGSNHQESEFAYVNISDGGGGYKGNFEVDANTHLHIHDSTISNSAEYGIWFGFEATSNSDIETVNTFNSNTKGNIGRN